MAKHCAMIVGFLVPHQCDNNAIAGCRKCGRRFCEEHINITHGNPVCTACQQGLEKPITVPKAAKSFTPAEYQTFDNALLDTDFDSDDLFSDLS